ncbi:MAG TPA: hypothetical protein VFH27_11285 [Longimicrobiaceae bacterium]|nr:hypothetical protein [Longimicrobiaceae bacterium]
MRAKLCMEDLNVTSFPTIGGTQTGGEGMPLPGDGPELNMKPDPTDYFASCSGCTFVGLQCC